MERNFAWIEQMNYKDFDYPKTPKHFKFLNLILHIHSRIDTLTVFNIRMDICHMNKYLELGAMHS